ncbi:MAG TPA: hypothetical protein VM344_05070, partial [Vitreimonas sp.]|nr:hypothetical protein [Vitreimonas sp.]
TRPVSGGPLSEPGPARFELPATCHQYGRVASSDGLDTRLSFAELDAGEQAVFDGASEWWVVLVAVRGDSAGAVFETQVDGGPIEGGVNGSAPSSPTATDAPA